MATRSQRKLEDEIKGLKNEIKGLKNELARAEATIQAMEDTDAENNARAKEQIDEEKNKTEEAKRDYLQLKNKYETLEESHKKLVRECNESADIEKELQITKNDMSKRDARIGELEAQLEDAAREKEAMETNYNSVTEERDKSLRRIGELSSELAALQTEKTSIEFYVLEMEKERERILQQLNDVRDELRSKQDQIDDTRIFELEKEKEEMAIKVENMGRSISAYEEKLREYSTTITNLKEEVERCEHTIEEQKSELHSLRRQQDNDTMSVTSDQSDGDVASGTPSRSGGAFMSPNPPRKPNPRTRSSFLRSVLGNSAAASTTSTAHKFTPANATEMRQDDDDMPQHTHKRLKIDTYEIKFTPPLSDEKNIVFVPVTQTMLDETSRSFRSEYPGDLIEKLQLRPEIITVRKKDDPSVKISSMTQNTKDFLKNNIVSGDMLYFTLKNEKDNMVWSDVLAHTGAIPSYSPQYRELKNIEAEMDSLTFRKYIFRDLVVLINHVLFVVSGYHIPSKEVLSMMERFDTMIRTTNVMAMAKPMYMTYRTRYIAITSRMALTTNAEGSFSDPRKRQALEDELRMMRDYLLVDHVAQERTNMSIVDSFDKACGTSYRPRPVRNR